MPLENPVKSAKLFLFLTLVSILILSQAAVAIAAPPVQQTPLVAGRVLVVTKETDSNTGIITFAVTVEDEFGGNQTVRISKETARALRFISYDNDGNPLLVESLPAYIEIDPAMVIPDKAKHQDRVATALATFFSDDIGGLSYDMIMEAHAAGNGFGVIAQALWLVKRLGGSAADFVQLLDAKKTGDYGEFALEDGTIPTSWGQLRSAVTGNPGIVLSQNHQDPRGQQNNDKNSNRDPGNNNQKENKDKSKNGNDHGNGHSNQP
jgi:hypothetical protein